MATKKQRKRSQKGRRHEYEMVWIDDVTGEELEEPPDDALAPARERRSDTKKPQQKGQPQRSSRATRTPVEPSWRRAGKRSLILGAVVFAFFGIAQRNFAAGLLLAVLYTALFVPFTYYLDRFAYRRWQRNQATKKR